MAKRPQSIKPAPKKPERKEPESGPWSRRWTSDVVDMEILETIFHRMSNGEALTAICRPNDMPYYSVVMNWVISSDEVFKKYKRARETQADFYADENVEIAEEMNVARARNRMEARRWHASKMNPRKYGEKIRQELSGVDGNPIELNQKKHISIKKLTPEERAQLKAVLLNAMSSSKGEEA